MPQTHMDGDFFDRSRKAQFDWERMKQRAALAKKNKLSAITMGAADENPLAKWDAEGMTVRKFQDDEQDVLRISVGGGVDGEDIDYCTYRGNRQRCLNLLYQACRALESRPDAQ